MFKADLSLTILTDSEDSRTIPWFVDLSLFSGAYSYPFGGTVAALDDDNDRYTDPGEPYEDYDAQPHAHARALAFDLEDNVPVPQVRDEAFSEEEQYEMDDNPEADLEEEEGGYDSGLGLGSRVILEDGADGLSDDRDIADRSDAGEHQQHRDMLPDDDDDEDIPEATHRPIPQGKKAGARDYEPRAKEVIERAITIYKTHVTADNAHPDNLTECAWAKSAWARAARDLDIQMKPDSRALELVCSHCEFGYA